jgi:hypothetical protein
MTDQTRNEQIHSTNFPIMEREGNTFIALLGFLPKEISSKTEEKDHIQKKKKKHQSRRTKGKGKKSQIHLSRLPGSFPPTYKPRERASQAQ